MASTAIWSSLRNCSTNLGSSPIRHCRISCSPFSHRVHTTNCLRCRSTPRYRFILVSPLLGSGVDAALRRSPHSHSSSYWPYVTLRSAGLTNLRVEVILPHCTSTACNLSAPDFLSWSIPPQNLHFIHAISVVGFSHSALLESCL